MSSHVAALHGTLLTQCAPLHAALVAELAEGLVLTGPHALARGEELRATGFAGPILYDAARYAGRARSPATAEFTKPWLAWQRKLDGPVLTDSGYVDHRDLNGLRSILRRTMRLGDDVLAVLPLHIDWLKAPQDREVLLSEITLADVPVAIALEHAADPLAVQQVVHGLLALIGSGVPVVLLRSDVSAVGALCHGAHAAAVGTTTSLRHVYPIPTSSFARKAAVAAYVPHLMSYLSVDKIAAAVQHSPQHVNLWTCECVSCGGRTMDHFATIRDARTLQERAFRHSVELLHLLRDELFPLAAAERRRAWFERCRIAGFDHLEMRHQLPGWHTPGFLGAWTEVWQPAATEASRP
ncbi:hypothetical protein FHS29_004184 [Saccharothrix tamanrassetensis]|uniref:Uncharacterized protein n=1 Tax=Saccharothrix tamanrassetensis TaxID=1051531 RepID=A0A841CJW7_9PSEU|nr:hypothetical protein [Saccharothrix tamanrassetensis]MBB5957589.1 hypothetical protein [Saccharothrix tamanrassetensis]